MEFFKKIIEKLKQPSEEQSGVPAQDMGFGQKLSEGLRRVGAAKETAQEELRKTTVGQYPRALRENSADFVKSVMQIIPKAVTRTALTTVQKGSEVVEEKFRGSVAEKGLQKLGVQTPDLSIKKDVEVKPKTEAGKLLLGEEPIKTVGKRGEEVQGSIKEKIGIDIGKPAATGIVAAGTILDLIPGFGAEKNAATQSIKNIAKLNRVEDIIPEIKNIFKIANISKTDDEIMNIAKTFETVEDEKQILDELTNIVKPPRLGGEVFQIFKSKIKEGPDEKSFIQKVKDFPGEFNRKIINRFSPLNKYEKQITGGVVDNIPIARKFEQVAGAAGKAEADIREFENSVIEPIRKNYDDFNAYLALKRTEDRLLSDASLKRVGDFTLDEVRAAINSFEESTDPKIVESFKKASESYQNLMEKSLKLQVDSGRISKAAYDAIKSENKFYAPFAIMKYIDEGSPVLGSNNMATTESIVKAIKGIKDDDFELKDILQTSAEKIYKSNILAEKNKAMLKLAELAKKDTEGALFKEVSLTKPPGKGNDIVNYFKDGEQKALEVPSDIALALKGASPQEVEIIGVAAQKFYDVMRAGATTGNVAFSIVNLLSDSVSTALISKYGINGVKDGLMFPVQFVDSLATAFAGNFKIGKGRLMNEYMDFLKSGAGNSTIAQEFRPGAFKTTVGVKRKGPGVILDTVAKFSNAMEETGKILGLKRGKMFEDIAKLPPDERAKALERITTEVRNYGGSPDFARRGAAAKDLNILFPFFNARLQGAARDINRLFGADGIKESAKAWTRIGAAIGIPTVGLMSYNLSKDNIDDYMQIPETERANYWMIPRDKYFTDSNGNKIREYNRIPKRNVMKPFANTVEQFMLFLHNKDPKAFKEIADELASYVSPISIEGNTIGERVMSVASGINPLGKVPLELTTNKNFFFKDNIVPKYLEGAEPKEQYKKSTPEIYKKIGNILNMSPIKIQHAATGFTGGFTGQFAVGKPEEGRSLLSETPVTKRFFRSASINRSDFESDIAKSQERQETKRVISKREALELHEQLKSLPKAEANSIVRKLEKEKPQVYSMLKTIVQEEKLDLNYRDKQVKQLGVQNGERALFIYEQAEKLTTREEKNAYIKEMRDKKILTAQVEEQLIKLIKENK